MCLSGTPSAMLSDTIDIALLERHEPHTRIAGLVLDETGAVPTLFAVLYLSRDSLRELKGGCVIYLCIVWLKILLIYYIIYMLNTTIIITF